MQIRLGILLAVCAALVAVALLLSGGPAASGSPSAPASRIYHDQSGWSLSVGPGLILERSMSGAGIGTLTEVTVANFAQRSPAIVSSSTGPGEVTTTPRAPATRADRFPAGGVAFRMFRFLGGPFIPGTGPDARFPVSLDSFTSTTELSVPLGSRARTYERLIVADGTAWIAQLWIGPAVTSAARASIAAAVASLRYPPPRIGQTLADGEVVIGPASAYPVGSLTLIHARGSLCPGGAGDCHPGRQAFYLVRAPGRLRVPELIGSCVPQRACTAPGAFYAIGWQDEDLFGGYRSRCNLRLDRADDEFFCTNSVARWDRVGRVLVRPRGARIGDPLQFAFVKVAWNGLLVLADGGDASPITTAAARLLWPGVLSRTL